MISLERVSVQRHGVIALDQFTHTVHPGQSVAVIGPVRIWEDHTPRDSCHAPACSFWQRSRYPDLGIDAGLTISSATPLDMCPTSYRHLADDSCRRMP